MNRLDPAAEYLRIAEHYRQMSDEELLLLVPEKDQLTDVAQSILANEIRQRQLKPEAEEKSSAASWSTATAKREEFREEESAKDAFSDEDRADREAGEQGSLDEESSYDEDRKLVDLCTVWSARDALKLQGILDSAGIPFFIGPEKATSAEQVTSDFSKGVVVQIMHIGLSWTLGPMQNFFPEDDPTPEEPAEGEEMSVRCPRCHSDEVGFDELVGELPEGEKDTNPKFKWTWDSWGNEGEDDGIVKED